MLSAVYYGPRDLRAEERPVPDPGPGQVLLRVSHVGICGSDLEAYQNGGYAEGTIIGHEFVGSVERVGTEVVDLQVGDTVTADATAPCGTCRACRLGRPSLCAELVMIGINVDGGMAEFYRADARQLRRLPPHLAPVHATLVDPLSNVLHAVRISSFRPGESAAVVGAGPIGLLLTNLLRVSGASEVTAFEPNPARRALAERVGADHRVDPTTENVGTMADSLTHGDGYSVVFVAAGSASAMQSAFDLAGAGGEIVVVGIVEQVATADYLRLVLSELTVKGSYLGLNEVPAAMDLLARGMIRADAIVTRTVRGIPRAIDDAFPSLVQPSSVDGKVVVEIREGS